MFPRRPLLAVGTLLVAVLATQPSFAVRLNSLALDVAPLTPAFQGGTFNYTAAAPASAAQARVTASPNGFGSSVTVNGVRVTPGVPSAPVALAVGQTTITVRATGRASWWSPITTDTYRIVVTRAAPGSPPSITSIQADPANAPFRTAVLLAGTANDPEQGDLSATIAWSSNLDGSLGVGASVIAATLSAGVHTVTAKVTDSSGTSASSTVAVTITNTPPVVTAAASAAEVDIGTPVTLSGTAADAEEGDLAGALRWTSSRDGVLGTGASLTATLSLGLHSISATATDGAGASAAASVEVRVVDPNPTTSARPNVLFILADDFGAEASALYPALAGNSGQVATPNIQSLAANGVVFDKVWANPVCSPTRAAILSGLYGHRTGVTNVGNVLPTATTTSIFEYVASSSPERYGLAVFGKWHLGTTIQHVRDSGIPEFRGFLSGGISNYFNWNATSIDGSVTNVRTYSTTALTDYAIAFIESQRQQSSDPWFLYLPYNAPHGTGASTGFQVPPANLHSVDVGGLQPGAIANTVPVYKAMIQALDTEIGRLLAAIGPVGSPERDNTVVIFMGDNGTPAAVKDVGARIRGSKSGIFEGGIRVPLVVSGAGVTRRGERDASLVAAPDLYATIAELAGIPVSEAGNSVSLVPLLSDAAATTGRTTSFSEMCSGTQAFYAVRGERYKLSYNNGTWGLYDLVGDPMEATNRFNDATLAAERTALEAELTVLRQSAQFGCFR
jgi:arylsulfatase A-like enzyme